jgi:chemotaxis protein CheX
MTEVIFALPEVMDSRAARGLAARLLELNGQAAVLDASAVRRMSALCLQVLLSARRATASGGASIEVRDPSPAFREGVTLLGAQTLIGEN